MSKKITIKVFLGCCLFISTLAPWSMAISSAEDDRKAFALFFKTRFPDIQLADYADGIYAIDANQRAQWQDIEEFPPYEIAIENGEQLVKTPFANGKSYASCFDNGNLAVRAKYPYFDHNSKQVKTLELAINECRQANGEKALPYKKGDIAFISAYIASISRGQLVNVKVEGKAALAAYEAGKKFYYSKRGQLNFSCADCHISGAGTMMRADRLSAGLGHTTHFPVYRSKWGEIGTLHRRFAGCNKNVRAKPLKAQSEQYRNLEYFLSYMSNGLKINGPGSRK